MALSFAHRGVLVIVLDMDNVDRILHNDPFIFDGSKVPIPLAIKVPLQIMVCYATQEEQSKINSMSSTPEALMQYLTRGWTDAPGDHNDPYKKI